MAQFEPKLPKPDWMEGETAFSDADLRGRDRYTTKQPPSSAPSAAPKQYNNPFGNSTNQALEQVQPGKNTDYYSAENQLKRMQEMNPPSVANSNEYKMLLRGLPSQTSSWKRDNELRNARVGGETLFHNPQVGSWHRSNKAGDSAAAALRAKYAAEDAARTNAMLNAYGQVSGNMMNREARADAADVAEMNARTNIANTGLRNASYAYGTDSAERQNMFQNQLAANQQMFRQALENPALASQLYGPGAYGEPGSEGGALAAIAEAKARESDQTIRDEETRNIAADDNAQRKSTFKT